MADIKLFNIKNGVKELESKTVNLEKELQTTIENNMDIFFGVTFLKSEYETSNGGRMDSIGIDENNCPVIFEYKRDVKDNVINQGLFYLDWLLDHKDSFKILLIEKLGIEKVNTMQIDWSAPRIICVAYDFTKYDEFAINQMTRNISLIRYRKFNDDLLMFEKVNENIAKQIIDEQKISKSNYYEDKAFEVRYEESSEKIKKLYEELKDFVLRLGDDVSENRLKLYSAFKKIKNIVCVEIFKDKLLLHIRLDPQTVIFEDGFSRNVTGIGHWGTGDVEVSIKNSEDIEKVKTLIERAYEEN
jgi:predicted transport protein